jgi:hypothetical protein
MTLKTATLRLPILVAFFLLPTSAQAQTANATVYAAGQESVQICLPTTGSYTPEVCEDNFDPVGLCEEGEEVELDHCSTYRDAPLCSKNGQRGQDCVCYYFCKKPVITPPTPPKNCPDCLHSSSTIQPDRVTIQAAAGGDSNPDALFSNVMKTKHDTAKATINNVR